MIVLLVALVCFIIIINHQDTTSASTANRETHAYDIWKRDGWRRRFIKEQKRIDEDERSMRRLHDGISLASPQSIADLTLGPKLSEKYGQMSHREILSLIQEADAPVLLHVYEVGHSAVIKDLNIVVQNWIREGGVFHGAIEIFGKEWSFGATSEDEPGIFCNEPRRCSMHTYRQSVYLGDSCKTPHKVEEILRSMLDDWWGPSYNLLHKNCCSFSNSFAQKLGVGDIPAWVDHLAKVGASLDDKITHAVQGLSKLEDHVVKDRDVMISAVGQRMSEPRKRLCCH